MSFEVLCLQRHGRRLPRSSEHICSLDLFQGFRWQAMAIPLWAPESVKGLERLSTLCSCVVLKRVIHHSRVSCLNAQSLWSDFPPFPLPQHIPSLLFPSHSAEQPHHPRTGGQSGRLPEQSPLTESSPTSWKRRTEVEWHMSFTTTFAMDPDHAGAKEVQTGGSTCQHHAHVLLLLAPESSKICSVYLPRHCGVLFALTKSIASCLVVLLPLVDHIAPAQGWSSPRRGSEESDVGRVRERVHVPGVGVMLKWCVTYDIARWDVTIVGKTQYAKLHVVLEPRVCVKTMRDEMTVAWRTPVKTSWDKHVDKVRMRKTCAR